MSKMLPILLYMTVFVLSKTMFDILSQKLQNVAVHLTVHYPLSPVQILNQQVGIQTLFEMCGTHVMYSTFLQLLTLPDLIQNIDDLRLICTWLASPYQYIILIQFMSSCPYTFSNCLSTGVNLHLTERFVSDFEISKTHWISSTQVITFFSVKPWMLGSQRHACNLSLKGFIKVSQI